MHFPNCILVASIIGFNTRLFYAQRVEEKHDVNTLVLLHVLFRHGDRTPDLVEIYPNDPYANQTYYPIGYGELTNVGKYREYLIGRSLREMYDSFLGIYTTDAVYARTTNYDRTKMSCELVLAGLYPPSAKQQWYKDLDWQPIPFDYEIAEKDRLLGDPRYNFPAYIRLYNDYLGSLNGIALYVSNRDLYAYLTKHTGWNIKRPKEVYNLYFVLKSEECIGFELPQWTKSVWPENITKTAVQEYQVSTATTQMRKLSGGFLLKKIVDDTKAKIEGAEALKNRKIFLYSGHENNIAYLLTLLDVFYPHVPPFGAYVTLEVHKINEIYGFKIYYQDYLETRGPRLLKLPGCDEFCPVDKFMQLVQEYLPCDIEECL